MSLHGYPCLDINVDNYTCMKTEDWLRKIEDIHVDNRGFLEIDVLWICYEFSDQGTVRLFQNDLKKVKGRNQIISWNTILFPYFVGYRSGNNSLQLMTERWFFVILNLSRPYWWNRPKRGSRFLSKHVSSTNTKLNKKDKIRCQPLMPLTVLAYTGQD